MKLYELDLLKIGHTIQMAGVIMQGEGRTFLCFFPDDRDDLPREALELNLNDWKHMIAQTDKLEAMVLEKASDGTLAKVILRKSQRQIDQHVTWATFRRDQFRCRYCAADDVPLTVDHVVCWEDGGPSIEENLVTACRKCNKVRGNLSYEQWLKHPRYLEHSQKLALDVFTLNALLVERIPAIPRMASQRSR